MPTESENEQYELKSTSFTPEEQKQIVEMVCKAAETSRDALADWRTRKKKNLQAAFNQSPSKIETLSKEDWMADRNVGVCGSTCDSLRAALYATAYNPDSVHAQPTEENDVDRAQNIERFLKAVLSDPRNETATEIMEFTTNIVQTGIGFMKTFWAVEEKWVDVRKYTKIKDSDKSRFSVETEKQRFEFAKLVNIPNVDDILCPDYGRDIDSVPYVIEVLHLYGQDIETLAEKGVFVNVDDNFKKCCTGKDTDGGDSQRYTKDEEQEINDVNSDAAFEYCEIDILEGYFKFKKDGKNEEYRFYVHEDSRTFLGGKPLRKILPSGRRPYCSCALDKLTGKLRGRSMPELIWDPCNQINTIFNQKTDFQYVINCPTGFYDVNDPNINGAQDLTPGKMYPTNSPNSVHFPSRTMSDAWAYNDIEFLLQMVERISGAAGYFLTSNSKNATATRDAIVAQKSDTRMGIWVRQVLTAECNIMNKMLELYQAWAPKELGARLLGKEGEKLFESFSAEQIQGNYDVRMSPDIVSGSKAYKSQLAMMRYNLMAQNPIVQSYAPGFWNLTHDTLSDTGSEFPDKYLPEQPKDPNKIDDEIENEFMRMMQGESFEPPEGASPEALKHYEGHMKQYEKIHLMPKEYRQLFEDHIFETMNNIRLFQVQMMQEQMANQMALGGIDAGFGQGSIGGPIPEQGMAVGPEVGGGAGAGLPGQGVAEAPMPGAVAGGTPVSEDTAGAGTVM